MLARRVVRPCVHTDLRPSAPTSTDGCTRVIVSPSAYSTSSPPSAVRVTSRTLQPYFVCTLLGSAELSNRIKFCRGIQ